MKRSPKVRYFKIGNDTVLTHNFTLYCYNKHKHKLIITPYMNEYKNRLFSIRLGICGNRFTSIRRMGDKQAKSLYIVGIAYRSDGCVEVVSGTHVW